MVPGKKAKKNIQNYSTPPKNCEHSQCLLIEAIVLGSPILVASNPHGIIGILPVFHRICHAAAVLGIEAPRRIQWELNSKSLTGCFRFVIVFFQRWCFDLFWCYRKNSELFGYPANFTSFPWYPLLALRPCAGDQRWTPGRPACWSGCNEQLRLDMGGWWSNLWSCAVGKDALPFFLQMIHRKTPEQAYIYTSLVN